MYNKFFTLSMRAIVIALIFMIASCAPYQARRKGTDYRANGEASWYGPGFNGRKTANGEKYNQRAFTAAHRTLPLGSTVKVTNVANGKSVVVRVNDRGPFVRGRIIDVSRAAAEELGMMGQGTAHVKLIALGGPDAEKPAAKEEAAKAPAAAKKKKGFKKLPAEEQPAEAVTPPPAPVTTTPPPKNKKFNPALDSSVPVERLYKQDEDVKSKTGIPDEGEQF